MANTSYRSENEYPILLLTVVIIGVIFLLSASVTACLAPLLVILTLIASYQANQSGRTALLRQAYHVPLDQIDGSNSNNRPFYRISQTARECIRRLRPGPVELFIVRGRQVNAYTFGLSDPKTVVVYASLVEIMDEEEFKFVLGHEMGHVALGHTWLNTVLGGLAGVPQTYGTALILTAAFRWWNRACEYSADRAGLLACQNPAKAVTTLVKLAAGDNIDTPAEFKRALAKIEAQDDDWGSVLTESLSTHPMIVKRIKEIQKYGASSEYRRLAAQLNQA
jgi:Zn-dependent protease with chaperone function